MLEVFATLSETMILKQPQKREFKLQPFAKPTLPVCSWHGQTGGEGNKLLSLAALHLF